jgi:hypothetical protein
VESALLASAHGGREYGDKQGSGSGVPNDLRTLNPVQVGDFSRPVYRYSNRNSSKFLIFYETRWSDTGLFESPRDRFGHNRSRSKTRQPDCPAHGLKVHESYPREDALTLFIIVPAVLE